MGIKDEIQLLRKQIKELQDVIQHMKYNEEKNKGIIDTLISNVNLLVERMTKLERPKGWIWS